MTLVWTCRGGVGFESGVENQNIAPYNLVLIRKQFAGFYGQK